jgi:hypothetical protein
MLEIAAGEAQLLADTENEPNTAGSQTLADSQPSGGSGWSCSVCTQLNVEVSAGKVAAPCVIRGV